MKSLRYNGVNIFNPIENKRDEIIRYFVNFYGEKHRQRIEYAYDNTTFLFIPKFKDEECSTTMLANYYIKLKIKELYKDCLKEYASFIGYENVFLFEPVSLFFIKKNLIEDKYVEGDDAEVVSAFARKLKIFPHGLRGKKVYSKKAKQDIVKKIDEYIAEYNLNYKQKIDSLFEELENILNALNSNLPDIKKIQESYEEKINEVIDEHFYKLISKLRPPRIIENLDEYKEIFRNLAKRQSLPRPVFTTEFQQKDYIKVLKLLGYDYGDNYQIYFTHRDLFEYKIFDKELIKSVKNLHLEKKGKLIEENKYLKDAYIKLSELNIKGNSIADYIYNSLYDYTYFDNSISGYVIPYIDSETNQLKNVCVCSDYFSMSTSTFVHEFNHAVKMNLIQETEHTYKVKCGLDVVSYGKTDAGEYLVSNYREAKNLDEIVNEWDSEDIVCEMEKNDFTIGHYQNRCSIYRRGFIPFNNLIKDNRETILKASLCNNRRLLFELMGDKNYSLVCDLANETLNLENTNAVIKEVCNKLKRENIKLSEIAPYCYSQKWFDWSDDAKKIFKYTIIANEYSEKLKKAKMENSQQMHLSEKLIVCVNEIERD